MPANIERRRFMQQMAQAIGTIPSLTPLSFGPRIIDLSNFLTQDQIQDMKYHTLVVIQLTGGNDGINTLVPYTQSAYYSARPSLALDRNEVLPITGDVALHPNMTALQQLFKDRHVAMVQGVGYPNPNRSHYESMSIWQRGSVDSSANTGWLGRYLDVAKGADQSLNAVNLDSLLWPAVIGENERAMAIESLDSFKVNPLSKNIPQAQSESAVKALDSIECSSCQEYNSLVGAMMKSGLDAITASDIVQEAAANYETSVTYPENDFSNRLKLAAQIITSSLKPVVVYMQIGGFDTHANQKDTQAALLETASDGIAAFYRDMEEKGKNNDAMIMTFSEFGRRVTENGSQGTDHGTAAPMFLIGGRISGGLYGTYPSLSDLDSGDLKYTTDFRQVYATVLQDWLGADATQILRSDFQKLNIL